MKILVVDDEKIKRVTLADDLSAQGHEVHTAEDGQQAWEKLQAEPFEVVVAVEAVKLGAFDFLTKPFRNEDLFPLLARIERRRRPPIPDSRRPAPPEDLDQIIIGCHPLMKRVKRMVEICARTDANVLLCGETGVGKDLVANVIHRTSHRRAFPFVKVGCTLLPPQLIESELYGHEKGSFTGADEARKGRFELAEGGTLYLDDVDDIPWEQQAKLLRAIEEKVFEHVGGTTPIRADVRIVASTKKNLLNLIAKGKFREDLYYRLDVLRINIPALRDRREDIPLLVEHLLKRIAGERPWCLEPQAMDVLRAHHWPGNVRELAHTLERAFLVGSGEITAELLTAEMTGIAMASPAPAPANDFHAAIERTERELLQRALEAAGGNKTAAATGRAHGRRFSCTGGRLGRFSWSGRLQRAEPAGLGCDWRILCFSRTHCGRFATYDSSRPHRGGRATQGPRPPAVVSRSLVASISGRPRVVRVSGFPRRWRRDLRGRKNGQLTKQTSQTLPAARSEAGGRPHGSQSRPLVRLCRLAQQHYRRAGGCYVPGRLAPGARDQP